MLIPEVALFPALPSVPVLAPLTALPNICRPLLSITHYHRLYCLFVICFYHWLKIICMMCLLLILHCLIFVNIGLFTLYTSFVVSNYLFFARHRDFSCMLQIVMSLEGLFRLPTITHLIITMTFGNYLKTHWWVTSWCVMECFLYTKCLV